MSSNQVSRNRTDPPSELVIIRRRTGNARDESHGGIWKIAYADFMTAMMAFFLVMWLLNATDKQTISAVASYFNPVKLTDRVTTPKGLHDMDSGARGNDDARGESRNSDGAAKGDPKAEGSFQPTYPEEVLFRNPYGVLEQLAAKVEKQPASTFAEASAGTALRDPFDPEFRFLVARGNADETKPRRQAQPVAINDAVAESDVEPATTPAEHVPPSVSENRPGEQRAPERPESADPAPKEEPVPRPVQIDVAEQIRSALRDASLARTPNVEVTQTSDGILISLTDEFDFGMFAIASAEPRPELVVIMEKIAEVLKAHPGRIIVRGHTDGRPFRTQTYDNWRLSTARAHMAYLMLSRGGVDEQRFERIEGHSDRSLKVISDPEAAQNRRIEILLRNAEAS